MLPQVVEAVYVAEDEDELNRSHEKGVSRLRKRRMQQQQQQ